MSKPYADSSALSSLARVERQTGESDEFGNPEWEECFTAYAKVSDRAGGEALINSQNKRVSTAKTTFTFRTTLQSAGILPTMRIIGRGFVHEILTPVVYSDDRAFVSVETVRRY